MQRGRILSLTLTVLWISAAQSPPGSRDGGALVLNRPIGRELAKGQAENFSVRIENNQFAQVVVMKKGLDVVLTVLDPAGKTIVTADSPNSSFGREPAAWIATSGGIYKIKIACAERSNASGKYELELHDLRKPAEADAKIVDAQTKLYAAAAKDRTTQKESRIAAIQLYEEAAALFRDLKDDDLQALCLHRIGAINSDLGESQKALDSYQKALTVWRAIGDRFGEAGSLNNIGIVYNGMGEQTKALDYYQQAFKIRHEIGDAAGEAVTSNNIAVIYSAMGEPQKALDRAQQVLISKRDLGDRPGQINALENIGVIYNAMGEAQKALDSYQQALILARELGDRSSEAFALLTIGSVYRDNGAEEKALDFFLPALKLAQEAHLRKMEGYAWSGMGDAYFFLGEKPKGIDAFEQTLKIDRELGNRSGEALSNIGLANIYCDLGGKQRPPYSSSPAEKNKALDLYLGALTVGRTLGDRFVEVLALMGAGVVSSDLGEKQKALEYLNPARLLFSVAHYRPFEGWALYETARVDRDLGKFDQASSLANRAIDIIEDLRTKMISQDLRTSFFAAVKDAYDVEIDVLVRQASLDPSKNFLADALNASERARARVLLDTLGEAGVDLREGVDAQLLQREHDVLVQLNAKETARLQTLVSKHTNEQLAELEKTVHDLTAQYEDVHTKIRERSPHYAALQFPHPLSIAEIQKEVLDSETLLLEFAFGEQRSFLWIVSSDGIANVVLPKRSELEKAAQEFATGLSNESASATTATGKELSRILLGEAANKLANKRLLVVADGALQYVPFAALPDPAHRDQPLMVNHEIVSIPSASTLAVLRRETANRKPAPKVLAVLADPVFSVEDSRLKRDFQKTANDEARGVNLRLKPAPGDFGVPGMRLPRLPGTRGEAAGILSFVPEDARKQALDFDASRATLTSTEMSQYRIVHLATHALLNTAHPDLSGVALSLVDRQGKPQNGFLRLNEIYNLKLSADLVVLSACQTALGKEVRGEGLVGLTRGFMYAGAPRVLASLWKVDDKATAELMKKLYGAMLGEKSETPAAALRDAQMAMWKTKGWESPYYWAAFVLQGDWK